MNDVKDLIPKTENPVILDLFSNVLRSMELILAGKSSDETGPFNEPIELLSYALAKKASYDLEKFTTATSTDKRLSLIFRNALDGGSAGKIVESLILGTYGFVLGSYNDEDFRYLYRYTLKLQRGSRKFQDWIKRALCFVVAIQHSYPQEVLHQIREWIRFLGAPLYPPSDFQDHCATFGIDIEPILSDDEYRSVLSLRSRPEYLEEAILNRPFDEVYRSLKSWTPDGLLRDAYKISEKRMYEKLQDHINDDMSIAQVLEVSEQFFRQKGFQVDDSTAIPVKLQRLSRPPPPDVMDPAIFERIPQKLRVNLLPAVTYSTSIKEVEIIFLGGPRIGRSGILIKTSTGGVLLDYGMSVANQMIPEWVPELETIDTILVSHSHLDHVGGLPIIYDTFEGKWCSTGITGAVTMKLLEDALKIGTPLPPRKTDTLDRVSRFTKDNVEVVSRSHVTLEVGSSSELAPGILVTPVDACHIPGSVAYLLDIEGLKILYTGDFNLDQSVLFPGASFPTDPDVLIFDGTYWSREDFDRAKVSQQLMNIIENYGPVIIPTFAVGRSQEILTILDKLGITNTRNVMVAGMAEAVTKMTGFKGKWHGLKKNKVNLEEEDVLVAGGGMMDGGFAKHHFEQHRDNSKAAVVLCGYLAPRTAGWNLIHGYEPHQCHVEYARLSAHSSASRLGDYIGSCKGKRIMVHTPVATTPKNLTIPRLEERIRLKVP